MKQKIEVSIPDGYEYKHMASPILTEGGGMLQVMLTKKNIKDFAFYVDEYLRSDDCTTNDMLCCWFEPSVVDKLRDNLKQNKLQFVPWEVKIGLVKFMCKDKLIHAPSVIFDLCNGSHEFTYSDDMRKMLPIEFVENIVL